MSIDTHEPAVDEHQLLGGVLHCAREWASETETFGDAVAIRCPHTDSPLRYEQRAERPVPLLPEPGAGPETTTHDVQAAAEGVVESSDDWIEFMGERFRLAESIGLMPLMKFAHASQSGLDSDDMKGMAALYTMIRDCVDQTHSQQPVMGPDGEPVVKEDGTPVTADAGPSEWDRFEEHATETKAEGEDFMDFISDAIKVISARPPRRRGNSSAGSPVTSEKSRAISSSPGTRVPPGAEGLVSVSDMARSNG